MAKGSPLRPTARGIGGEIKCLVRFCCANRGEIAVRIIAACRQLAISMVVVYSTADEQAQFVQMADEAICVGPASAQESYLNREA